MYWWPPSLYAFDPSERRFVQETLPYADAVAAMGGPVPSGGASVVSIPNEYDRPWVNLWGMPEMYVGSAPMGRKYGGLAVYWDIVRGNAHAEGDPDGGGLPPDVVNPDGSITIHYYDFGDSEKIRRKRVTYVADPKTGAQVIANRNPSEGGVPQEWIPNMGWRKEGADAEREFGKSGLSIVNAVGQIASAVLAFIPGGQAPAAAFAAMWSFTMAQLKNGGKPPDVQDVLSFVGAEGKAVGPGMWGIVSKNADVQKLFSDGFIAKMAALPGEYKDKIADVVNDLGSVLPRLNLPVMIPSFNAGPLMAGAFKKTAADAQKLIQQSFYSALTPPIGVPGKEVAIASDPAARPDAFDRAMIAFQEPDAQKRAQIRRDFMWAESNSSAVTMGDPVGVGAHNEQEQSGGLMAAAVFFDSYLSAAFASLLADVESKTGIGIINAMQELRLHDKHAQLDLYNMISSLRSRYRMA